MCMQIGCVYEARRAGRNVVHWKIAHCEMVAILER